MTVYGDWTWPSIFTKLTHVISTLVHKQEGNSQQRNNNDNGSVTDCHNIANERHKHDQCYQFKCYYYYYQVYQLGTGGFAQKAEPVRGASLLAQGT